MEKNEFSNKLISYANRINVDITGLQAEQFYTYMKLLQDWNEKINLTAITEPNEVITKHFIDSITINKYIKENFKVIDVGTGAGFPGIPLSIIREDVSVTLMDSLNKRIKFLDEVVKELNLKNVDTIHSRAEELGHNKEYRERFDIATSRAVAPLNILLEYLMPFVKVGGYCICMKGSNIDEEIKDAKKALQVLSGEIINIDSFELPETDYGRNIIVIKKTANNSNKYPRKPGTPSKEPLI